MIYAVLIFLALLSAFFSSLETGLLAFGEVSIRKWSENKIKTLDIWLNDPSGVITGILIGNNLVNILFSTLFTILVVGLAGNINISELWIESVSIAGSSIIILTIGEIIPKTFANTHPDKVVTSFYVPFMKFYSVSKALIGFFNKISFTLMGIIKVKKEKTISREEVQMALTDMENNGILEEESTKMLERVLYLTQKTVGDVMIPREEICALDITKGYEQIINDLIGCHYSRIPVYEENIDNLKGIVYIKDVIKELSETSKVDFDKILRKAHTTYPGRNCQHLLHELINIRTHCSIVFSNNRIIGLITIEDLIEEVVGEIYDEYDNNDTAT